jgi:hypothetical protein
MPEKVTFDGETSVVLVDEFETEVDAETHLYSGWKRFAQSDPDGLKYRPAFRTVAGDPISPTKSLGAVFFITNDWLIRPWLGNHELVVEGDLYAETGKDIFTPVTGAATVGAFVERSISSLVDVVTVSGTASVPAVVTGTLVDEQRVLLEETHDALGQYTGTPISVPPITGGFDPGDRIMLEELWYMQALGGTGTPLEVSEEHRMVTGIFFQEIEADTPASGTVRVTRTA